MIASTNITNNCNRKSITKRYSSADWAYVLRAYPRQPLAATAARVGVPTGTLARHLHEWRRDHGCGPSRRGAYTASDLARACGCPPMTVTRWARAGLLGPPRKPAHRGLPYVLSDDTLTRFLRHNPLLWRRYPVPPDVWRWVNGCGTYTPGSPAWYLALAPWPCPDQAWLESFIPYG